MADVQKVVNAYTVEMLREASLQQFISKLESIGSGFSVKFDMSTKILHVMNNATGQAFDFKQLDNTDKTAKKVDKWIPKKLNKGALHKYFNVPEGEKIPVGKMRKKYEELQKKAEGDKKLNAEDTKLFKQLHFALVMRDVD